MIGCYNYCGFGFIIFSWNLFLNKIELLGMKYNGWGEEKEVICDGLVFNLGRVLVFIFLVELYCEC